MKAIPGFYFIISQHKNVNLQRAKTQARRTKIQRLPSELQTLLSIMILVILYLSDGLMVIRILVC